MSWLWGSSTNAEYEEAVEKACSPLKLPYPQGEDIALNLEITDMIRSKAVQPKPAMQALKQRIGSKNGRVQMYGLSLVDTCIKNGGDHFLAEIASKEFVDEMASVIKSHSTNPEVRTMAVQMFQQWALAFRSKKELSFFVEMYNELKHSGIKFPPPPASEASSHLLDTMTAPAWVDSDVCMRCRTAFTFTNRKHHCRNCGLVFDQACSSRTMPLPKFGIKEEVRVCESCWVKAGKNKPAPAVPGRTPRSRRDYDADLQRAIELSLAQSQPGAMVPSEPPLRNGTIEDDDEQLRLAIEASLREMERARPSAPSAEEPEFKPLPTFDLTPRETETILTFSNTLDQMAAYGERDLRRFPLAHMLHDQAYALGPKLHRNSEEKTTKTQMLAEMQAKLNEAIGLYGNILDGQQAYAARAAQAAQQQQQQQYYGYQPYAPYAAQQQQPYAHGHQYSQPAAPPQAQPQSPAPAHTAPGMYPAMPVYGYAEASYAPPQAQQQPYGYQPWANAPSRQASTSYAPAPAPAPAQPSGPVYNEPQGYGQTSAPEPQLPGVSYASTAAPQATSPALGASAPPVDLASHPSLSPRSTKSNLPAQQLSQSPSRSATYGFMPSAPPRSESFSSAMTAPTITSPTTETPYAPYQSPPAVHQQLPPIQQQPAQQQPIHQQPAEQQTHQPAQSAQQAPSTQHQHTQPIAQSTQQWAASAPAAHSQPAQQPVQQGYTPSMFPSAPPSFPTAPKDEPAVPVQQEALLIEL